MEPNSVEVTIEFEPIGRKGKVQLIVRFPDGSTYSDKVDVTTARGRTRFIKAALKGRDGIPQDALEEKLLGIAASILKFSAVKAEKPEGDAGVDPSARPADVLVQLASDPQRVELFHTPGRHDAEPYASITIDNHRETWPVYSRGFRHWLVQKYHELMGDVPPSQAVKDALDAIAGRAMFVGRENDVHVRLAEHEGAVWLDLGDDSWRAVRITETRWELIEGNSVAVRFVRKRGMKPLAAPVPGGAVDELRPFINVPDEDSWKLVVACLLAYLRPRGPYPVLIVNGEEGSAKSTLCKLLRKIIDPNKVPLRRPPREDRDLMIAASNSWVIGFDNMSDISESLSDSLSSLATGGGFGTRELYTNEEEKLFDAMRPVLLNGIGEVATKSDFLGRAVVIQLPVVTDAARRDEAELYSAFEKVRPRILGALLTAVSTALGRFDAVRPGSMPRMADFARWVCAAEPGLGWPEGSILAAYRRSRAEARLSAIEASPIGIPLLSFMEDQERWQGTAKALLLALAPTTSGERAANQPGWPKSPRALRECLKCLAPNLRAEGIEVRFGKRGVGHDRARLIDIEKVRVQPSGPTGPSDTPSQTAESPLPAGRSPDDPGRSGQDNRPAESGLQATESAIEDDPDDPDDVPADSVGAMVSPPDGRARRQRADTGETGDAGGIVSGPSAQEPGETKLTGPNPAVGADAAPVSEPAGDGWDVMPGEDRKTTQPRLTGDGTEPSGSSVPSGTSPGGPKNADSGRTVAEAGPSEPSLGPSRTGDQQPAPLDCSPAVVGGDPAGDALPTTQRPPCYECKSDLFWRLRGSTELFCGKCVRPGPAPEAIEWLRCAPLEVSRG